jgi:hypothetical protein
MGTIGTGDLHRSLRRELPRGVFHIPGTQSSPSTSSEFTKLAVANIETRNLTQAVVDSWKPVVANAIDEWAKQRTLRTVLNAPAPVGEEATKIETTKEEFEAFETVKRLLGKEMPVGYEDSVAYFKIHLAEKRTWVMARLQLNRKAPLVWVPLLVEEATPLAGGRPVHLSAGWAVVTLEKVTEVANLGGLLKVAYDKVKRAKSGGESDDAAAQ